MSNPAELRLVWVTVILLLPIAALCLRGSDTDSNLHEFFQGVTIAFIALNLIILGNLLIGLIGLAWLKITSPFWLVWQLSYLLSDVAVRQVFPIVIAVLLVWGCYGRVFLSYSNRSLATMAIAVAAVGTNIAANYLLNKSF